VRIRFFAALLAAVALLGAQPQPRASAKPAVPLAFEPPAGYRPAGALDPADPFAQILPSGRLIVPEGTSTVVGINALGLALSPDGKYAIVANADERRGSATSTLDPRVHGGYSLSVVEVASMRLVEQYRAPDASFFTGILAVPDPLERTRTLVFASGGAKDAVFVFELDSAGHLIPDRVAPQISLAQQPDARFANAGRAFPATLVASKSGALIYVVDNLANAVVTVDVATRALAGSAIPVGDFPFGAARAGDRLIVANEGLARYRALAAPAAAPEFRNVRSDPGNASSLSVIPLGVESRPQAQRTLSLEMDRPPDGLQTIGGAHPTAIAATRDGRYAFVTMTNVDRIAVVGFERGHPRVVGGTELRLYDGAPYGTQPGALALSGDQSRLYVALAGLNAVAVLDVRDPVRPHRIGLIPSGWYPSALALSADNTTLFVANAKGLDHEPGFTGDQPTARDAKGRVQRVQADSTTVWATLQKIELASLDIGRVTRRALTYERIARKAVTNPIVPQGFTGRASRAIKHVVLILQESKSYDALLGDLTDAAGKNYGSGEPGFVAFDESVTPNLHALARTYGLATNFYADAEESKAGHQFAAGGIATAFAERVLRVARVRESLGSSEDPEDYPRSGYIFDSLARKKLSYRDYGDLVGLSGYDGSSPDPGAENLPLHGLGGLYAFDVPAPAALAGHIDLDYPGWNLRVRDTRRAQEFIRDLSPLVAKNALPEFIQIWLPANQGAAASAPSPPAGSALSPSAASALSPLPPIADAVADGDRALGTIVEYLTHLPQWKDTAIFVMPAAAEGSRDHVHAHRSFALVISPYAKRQYLGARHLSTASVLKTEEELLGLPPLSLGDVLAADLRDFFTTVPDLSPYARVGGASK
jgi:DNA-binding beta-propeller fold protein YncE